MRSTSSADATQNAIRFAFGACSVSSVIPKYAVEGSGSVVAQTFHSPPW
jgi:hypothetical protein